MSNFYKKIAAISMLLLCAILVSCGAVQQEPQIPSSSSSTSDVPEIFEDEKESTPEKTEEEPRSLIDYCAPVQSTNTAQDWTSFLEKASSNPGVELDLDYLAAKGTPVYSPIRGVVEKIETKSVWPFGRHLVVQPLDNPDVKIVIAHLDAVEKQLKVGDEVDNTTQIGRSGTTGSISYPAVSISVQQKTEDRYHDISVEKWGVIFNNWPNCISSNLNEQVT